MHISIYMGTIDYFSLVICKWNDNSAIKSELDNAEVLYLMMMEAPFAPSCLFQCTRSARKACPFQVLARASVELEIDGEKGREEERIGSKGYRRTGQQIDILKTAF